MRVETGDSSTAELLDSSIDVRQLVHDVPRAPEAELEEGGSHGNREESSASHDEPSRARKTKAYLRLLHPSTV